MLDSQGPGKAVSEGPEQVVFFQHDCARLMVKRVESTRNGSNLLKMAIFQ